MCENDKCEDCNVYHDALGIAYGRFEDVVGILQDLITQAEHAMSHIDESTTLINRVL